MVKEIAKASGKKIVELKCLAPAVKIGSKMTWKIGGLVNKAFGNNCYMFAVSNYNGIKYQNISMKQSVMEMNS